MASLPSFRESPQEAVRLFRPVLQALDLRGAKNQAPVYLAAYRQLDFLNLDECSIQCKVRSLNTTGIFIVQYTKKNLLRAFIILNENLFNFNSQKQRELRKIVAVHEFVHFMTTIYTVSQSSVNAVRKRLVERLESKVDKLWGPDFLMLYYALSGKTKKNPPELTDKHFRFGFEGKTPDYKELFLHFMFSRELFEEYFDADKQKKFRELFANETTSRMAIRLVLSTLKEAAASKDVPLHIAKAQLLEWVRVYK